MPASTTNHEYYMAHALRLAERGLYSTRPNPRVGCVLVHKDTIVGEGWHRFAGEPHAEVNALNDFRQRSGSTAPATGITAYVTLEPCSHYGRTPPCAEALVAAGVSEVVIAMEDPNPQVSGAGRKKLEQAGIKVISGVLLNAAEQLNAGFVKRMSEGRPLVRLKLAASLDGRTAMASGESQWITGPKARADVQRLRARSCAVVTGIGSLLKDDPALTLRAEQLNIESSVTPAAVDVEQIVARQPLRVVVDSHFRTPVTANLLQQPGPILVAGAVDNLARQQLIDAGVDTLLAAGLGDAGPGDTGLGENAAAFDAAGKVDLPILVQLLAQRDCNEVLVEAGPKLAGAFIAAGLVDELVLYIAPTLLGHQAQPLAVLEHIQCMADQVRLQIDEVRHVGGDLRISAIVSPRD